jgi:hypothetical protein
VGFVVGEMALEQVFIIAFKVFPIDIIYQCSIVINFYIAQRKTWGSKVAVWWCRRRSERKVISLRAIESGVTAVH